MAYKKITDTQLDSIITAINNRAKTSYVDNAIVGKMDSVSYGTITAAATCNIGAAGTKSIIQVNGTTTITSLGTSTTGTFRTLLFNSSVSITHGTNIIMMGSVSTSFSSGDTATFLCTDGASGKWKCVSVSDYSVSKSELKLLNGSSTSLTTTEAVASSALTKASLIDTEKYIEKKKKARLVDSFPLVGSLASSTGSGRVLTLARAGVKYGRNGGGNLSTSASGVALFGSSDSYFYDDTTYNSLNKSFGLTIDNAATNHLAQSNTFATTWVNSAMTITANTTEVKDPFGNTTTATKVVPTTADTNHWLVQAPIAPAPTGIVTFSCWIKNKTKSQSQYLTLAILDSANTPLSWFGSNTGETYSIDSSYANGWERHSISISSALATYKYAIVQRNGTVGSTLPTVVGDTNSVSYIFGAMLEQTSSYGDLPSAYVPTTTAKVSSLPDVVTFPLSGLCSAFSFYSSFTKVSTYDTSTIFKVVVDANNYFIAQNYASSETDKVINLTICVGGVVTTQASASLNNYPSECEYVVEMVKVQDGFSGGYVYSITLSKKDTLFVAPENRQPVSVTVTSPVSATDVNFSFGTVYFGRDNVDSTKSCNMIVKDFNIYS